MDYSEVKAVVDENIERLVEALGIPHWRLEVEYGPCSRKDWKAECVRHECGSYCRATITIDPIHAESPEDVLRSLIHELLHIVLAPFDLYRNAITTHLKDESPQDRTEKVLWTHAVEQVVMTLEKGLAIDLRFPQKEEADEQEQ